MSSRIDIKRVKQQGVALLEVLIVFFVLSVGLLGMAALQMRSMQYNQSSYLRSQATTAAYDMLDRIRVNGGVIAPADLVAWNLFLDGSLPGVAGTHGTAICNAGICTITIQWTDRSSGSAVVDKTAVGIAPGNAGVVVSSRLL